MDEMRRNRRRNIRYPSFDVKEIFYDTDGADLKCEKVILRDESHQGFGAVYTGADLLDKNLHYYFKNADRSYMAIALVWSRKVAENVFLLGFEILLDKIYREVPVSA